MITNGLILFALLYWVGLLENVDVFLAHDKTIKGNVTKHNMFYRFLSLVSMFNVYMSFE